MICPSCGCKNRAEELYCDECGVLLKDEVSAAEQEYDFGVLPLVAEQTVGSRFKVEKIVQNDSECIIYEIKALKPEDEEAEKSAEALLMCEFPSNPKKASEIFNVLKMAESESLWHFDEIADDEKGEPRYLVGKHPGVSLRNYLAEHKISFDEAAVICCDVLDGLKAMHNFGFIHNGISLDSVWIGTDGKARLVRFDRCAEGFKTESEASVIYGYSAPEAYGLEGGELTRKSDIYSVGALMFYLLTGRELNLNEEPANAFPANLRIKAKSLVKIVEKALKRCPDDRWLSASEMLEAVSNRGSVQAEPEEKALEAEITEYSKTTVNTIGDYIVAKKSHVGAVRKINQDAFLELTLAACERDVPTNVHFIAVIDGMGGEAEGDKAASLAARAIAAELTRLFLPLKNDCETTVLLPLDRKERNAAVVERVIKKANKTIFDYACKSSARKGMGCTISCVLLDGDNAVFGHVGDTRGYKMTKELDQVTTDHSMVGQLVQMGLLTREEARHSSKRSIIYRALGTQPEIEAEIYHRTMESGEYILLCCDGIWEYYSDEELLSYFNSNLSPSQICEKLVSVCLQRGANDNTTAAVIKHR